jgi:hypothetical protein
MTRDNKIPLQVVAFLLLLALFLLSLVWHWYGRAFVEETRDGNGNLRAVTSTDSKGQPHGVSKVFRPDGSLESEIDHSHGQWLVKRCYRQDGSLWHELRNTFSRVESRWFDEYGNESPTPTQP